MTALGLDDIEAFPFVDAPDKRHIQDGIKLLDWLVENSLFYPIKLHTMNPVGRENMLRMIRRYWG